MKNYKGIMSIGNVDLKDLVIEESRFLMSVSKNKGGWIV